MEDRSDENGLPLSQDMAAPHWDQAPKFGRRKTLRTALQRLHQLQSGATCIVETGTLRDERPQACNGDGWSTLAFGWYAAQTGGQAYTVDISLEAIETSKRLTTDYATNLHYVCADSLAFLREWSTEERGEIHLLYLDSFDYFDHDASENHHLHEAQAALHALAPCCLVLFDDTVLESTKGTKGHEEKQEGRQGGGKGQFRFSGKGARAIPFLLEHGFRVEWCEGGQALLSRGAPVDEREVDAQQHSVEASLAVETTGAKRMEPITDHRPPTTVEAPLDPTPLCHAPSHFEAVTHSPALSPYLAAILRLCSPSARTCEIGFDTGYPTVSLSLHGLEAEGICTGSRHVERARMVNNTLHGQASFRLGDPFDFYREEAPRYGVVHHHGLLHRFTVPYIHALLAQQVASADWVVFSVPSAYASIESETGDARLLPIEEWQHLLAPSFEITDLRYYGDPTRNSRDYVLVVLKGQSVTDDLRSLMHVPADPYPLGISAIVLARNEERHMADCLTSLKPCADEIIVCDMESSDDTVQIARHYTDNIVLHPLIPNFDSARNAAAMRARFSHVLFLDADERIPPKLAQRLREIVMNQGDEFEAMTLPFLHHFAGRWMMSLYPGYKAPSLFKNGKFFYNSRPHQGARVDGRIACFPADNLELAPLHFSYDSLRQYLDKFNRYTDTEADNLHNDGATFDWRRAIEGFVRDFQATYAGGRAAQDGVHGFLWAFMSGFYRFTTHAKLFEHRFKAQKLTGAETAIPSSLEEMLEFALAIIRHKPATTITTLQVDEQTPSREPSDATTDARQSKTQNPKSKIDMVVTGPLDSPSGYGEECRNILFALQEAGVAVAGEAVVWSQDIAALTIPERQRLEELVRTPVAPGFVQIVENFPPAFARHPQARLCIGRTMFETDRLPIDWVRACNEMDAILVPSEFNRQTFLQAGVQAEKLAVVPGCFDPTPWKGGQWSVDGGQLDAASEPHGTDHQSPTTDHRPPPFTFLSIFDWTRHKGWDVLLRGFLEAFEGREDVALVLKVWSTQGYTFEQIREQATTFARQELGHDLTADRRIRFVPDYLTPERLHALYRSSDAFVLPSRGEGWGRPYMEAMASALPTIGTNWSGNTAFMTNENSYLLDYQLVAVPEVGWRELPQYRGHRWAEPSLPHLKETLRRVVEERGEAQAIGRRAQEEVCTHFSRAAVAPILLAEIARLLKPNPPAPFPKTLASHRWEGGDVGASCASTTMASSERQSCAEVPLPLREGAGGLGSPAIGKSKAKGKGKKATQAATNAPAPGSAGDAQRSAPEPPPSQRGTSVLGKGAGGLGSVRYEGARFVWHSLAQVNRELCLGLLQTGKVELSVVPTEPEEFGPDLHPRFSVLEERAFAPLSAPAAVHIRHHFPPRFDRPHEGALVLVQPWEFGFAPKEWIAPILQNVDQLWCYSNPVRQVYLDSGIPEEKLAVVPLGVDTEIFNPEAPPYVFTTEAGSQRWSVVGGQWSVKCRSGAALNQSPITNHRPPPFTFLFVGGTLQRKGIDILLDAYLSAFSAYDEVLLVVKDTCTNTVYRDQNARERILALCSDRTRAPIVYLYDDLPPHQMAGLYTTADCLVQPYRGEGFCLPALEAMACGIPVVVPEGGPTDDFVDESVGWRVPAQRRPMGGTAIGPFECVGKPWMLEVAPEDLARLLRHIAANPDEPKRRGQAGAARVRKGWTWGHTANIALRQIEALQLNHPPAARGTEAQRKHRGKIDNREPAAGQPLTIGAASDLTLNAQRSTLLSLCMIVKNEERVLDACLSSARPYFDEIIVVDTGSTDRTVEIARRHGAKVSFFAWCDDFSAARNASMAQATGEWIFWMDADDTLPPKTGEAIRAAALHAPAEICGFVIPVQFVDDGTAAGGTRVDHVKLFRNRAGLRWEGRIHEQILPSLREGGGQVARLDVVVLHSGYDTSPEGQKRKHERDDRLLDLDLQDQPTHPFRLFNRGMTDHYRGNHEAAVEWLRRSLQHSGPADSQVRKVYALLSVSLRQLGQLDEAMATLEEGLAVVDEDPDLHFQSAYLLSSKEEYTRAKEHYLRCLNCDTSGHFSSVDMGILGYKTYHNLGGVCLLLGSYEEAKEWWVKAVEAAPSFLTSAFDLFNAAVERGDRKTSDRMLEVVREAEGRSENWVKMGVRLAEAGEDPDQANGFLADAVEADPAAMAPRLVLARRLLASGCEAEATAHLMALSERGVAEAAFYLGVAAIRRDALEEALSWMERAFALNPEHEETRQQIDNLKRAIANQA